MKETSEQAPTRIRTFAADLEAARGRIPPATTDPKKPVSHTAPLSEKKPKKPVPPKSTAKAPIAIPKPTAPTKKPNRKSSKDAPIPAFHELNKKASVKENIVVKDPKEKKRIAKIKKKQKKTSPKKKANIIGVDAKVITDTKSDRFKLFPSIISSLRSWFKAVTTPKKKKTPKYTVPETERRKGVIQRATSKTGTIFTADSETIKEHIRHRRLQESADDQAETFWTPQTETGYKLLEPADEISATPQKVVVEYKKSHFNQPVEVTTPATQTPIAPTSSVATEVPPITEQTPATSVPPTQAEVPPVTEVMPIKKTEADLLVAENQGTGTAPVETTESVPPQSVPVSEDESAATITAPEPTKEDGKDNTIPSPLVSTKDTNTLTLIVLSIIIGLVVIVVGARALFSYLTAPQTETTVVETTSKPLIHSAKLVTIPVTVKTVNQLPLLVNQAVATGSAGMVEYTIVSTQGDEISTAYLFQLLHFHTTPNLRQSITTTHFVSVNHSRPALLLHFVDTDTVRGGLLNWESLMPRDFSTLFEITNDTEAKFIDETISGIDTRVLYVDNKAVLVYGILNENTALIADSAANFAQIVELGYQ